MNETESAFEEIQDSGMDVLGTKVDFGVGGQSYSGIINNPDIATQMLTGSYQGRAEIIVLATRSQFADAPPQRGVVTINQPDILAASQWNIKQTNPYGSAHYAMTMMRQLPTA